MRFTNEQKAQAIARVRSGDSPQLVAQELGCTERTVRRWAVDCPRMSDEKKDLAERVAEISERIEQKQIETREILIQRIAELVPQTDDLRAVATAYGIVTEKALLTAGKPTSIHADAGISIPDDASADELRKLADQLRSRRKVTDERPPVPAGRS
jgi:transposase-like protein